MAKSLLCRKKGEDVTIKRLDFIFGLFCTLVYEHEELTLQKLYLNATIVHPREVFKTAISRNANSAILAHNHPSGNVEPSSEDIKITERMRQAGDIIGIKLLDHIVVSRDNYKTVR